MKHACLAQLVERTAFNRMVLGSSPRVGNKTQNYKQQKPIHFKDEARVRIPYVVKYYIGLVVRMRKKHSLTPPPLWSSG